MDLLAVTAATWGLALNSTQLSQFMIYASELRRWNERINLTAISDESQIISRHFLDSLRCALSWGEIPGRLADIGTGAGFPGIPLKILYPELQLFLIESIGKKATFLRHIVDRLGLSGVEVVVARAEDVGHAEQHRERYDVVVARAVAELRILTEYCLPLCCVGGRFLAPKGPQLDREIKDAQTAITLLGGRIAALETVTLPGIEQRTLIVIEKIAHTPPLYPRAVGIPAKRP